MTVHKADSHGKPGRRPRAPSKEGATFDTELQRYVMPSERATMSTRQEVSETQRGAGILEKEKKEDGQPPKRTQIGSLHPEKEKSHP